MKERLNYIYSVIIIITISLLVYFSYKNKLIPDNFIFKAGNFININKNLPNKNDPNYFDKKNDRLNKIIDQKISTSSVDNAKIEKLNLYKDFKKENFYNEVEKLISKDETKTVIDAAVYALIHDYFINGDIKPTLDLIKKLENSKAFERELLDKIPYYKTDHKNWSHMQTLFFAVSVLEMISGDSKNLSVQANLAHYYALFYKLSKNDTNQNRQPMFKNYEVMLAKSKEHYAKGIKLISAYNPSMEISSYDFVVGMNHMAFTNWNYEESGIEIENKILSSELFKNSIYVSMIYAKDLQAFTKYSAALNIAKNNTPVTQGSKNAISILLDGLYVNYDKTQDASFVKYLIQAKDKSDEILGRKDVSSLVKYNTNFKSFLMENGWSEKDFE